MQIKPGIGARYGADCRVRSEAKTHKNTWRCHAANIHLVCAALGIEKAPHCRKIAYKHIHRYGRRIRITPGPYDGRIFKYAVLGAESLL